MLVGKLLAMGALAILLLFGINYLSESVVMGPAKVIDGDSLAIGTTRVTLAGMTAVNLDQTCTFAKKRWPCGQHAAQALMRAIGDRSVTCRPTGGEIGGERLARCFIGADRDLGQEMVAMGWAIAEPIPQVDYSPDQDRARRKLAGVWSSFFDKPNRKPAEDLPL